MTSSHPRTDTTTAAQAAPITGLDLAAYLVPDPAAAIAFYRDVLGLTPTEIDPEGRGAEFTLSDGSAFGVWRPDDGPKTGGTVMFAVDDLDAATATFRARGATLSEPLETPVCRMAFGEDPAGNGYIVHQRTVRD